MKLLDFLTGGGLGALAGALSGIAGKFLDLKAKDKEIELRKVDHAHELALRDKDREMAAQEASSKLQIHQTDADAGVAIADLSALAKSYEADRATYGDHTLGRIVDFVRGITRPLLTYVGMALVVAVTLRALRLLSSIGLSQEALADILGQGMFISSMAITWWFAARPGKLSDYARGKR